MLEELDELLSSVPKAEQVGWIVNPQWVERSIKPDVAWFQPTDRDLRELVAEYSNQSIAQACGQTEAAVRKWLKASSVKREREFKHDTGPIPSELVERMRGRAKRSPRYKTFQQTQRMTKDRVSRIISHIGQAAGVVVRQDDERTGTRLKYASAHDIRRGYAKRLIDVGVSAETIKVVMRHRDCATTEKHYGAIRSTQSAGEEVRLCLSKTDEKNRLVGGLVGGQTKTPQLSAEELSALKSLLTEL